MREQQGKCDPKSLYYQAVPPMPLGLDRVGANVPTTRDTIGAALNRESDALDELYKALAVLEQRLNPVLMAADGVDQISKAETLPISVRSLVEYHIYKIRALCGCVNAITERLEL